MYSLSADKSLKNFNQSFKLNTKMAKLNNSANHIPIKRIHNTNTDMIFSQKKGVEVEKLEDTSIVGCCNLFGITNKK